MVQTEALNNNEQVFDAADLMVDPTDVVDGGGDTGTESINNFNSVTQKIDNWNNLTSVDQKAIKVYEELKQLYNIEKPTPEDDAKIKENEKLIDDLSIDYFNKDLFPVINNFAKWKLTSEKIPPVSNIQVNDNGIVVITPFDKKSNTQVEYIIDSGWICKKHTVVKAVWTNAIIKNTTDTL